MYGLRVFRQKQDKIQLLGRGLETGNRSNTSDRYDGKCGRSESISEQEEIVSAFDMKLDNVSGKIIDTITGQIRSILNERFPNKPENLMNVQNVIENEVVDQIIDEVDNLEIVNDLVDTDVMKNVENEIDNVNEVNNGNDGNIENDNQPVVFTCIPFIVAPYGVKGNNCTYDKENKILSLQIDVVNSIIPVMGKRNVFPYGTETFTLHINKITFNVEKLNGDIESRESDIVTDLLGIKTFTSYLDDVKRIFI